ncbi:hypothetical protein FRC10_005776, partial [Ceratobasidium sp. 414]
VFENGQLHNFLTRYEKPVTATLRTYGTHVIPLELTGSEGLRRISDLCLLLSRLHTKGLIHGDVKPSNLLHRPAGDLRFCDFAEAPVDDTPLSAFTMQYAPPS